MILCSTVIIAIRTSVLKSNLFFPSAYKVTTVIGKCVGYGESDKCIKHYCVLHLILLNYPNPRYKANSITQNLTYFITLITNNKAS